MRVDCREPARPIKKVREEVVRGTVGILKILGATHWRGQEGFER